MWCLYLLQQHRIKVRALAPFVRPLCSGGAVRTNKRKDKYHTAFENRLLTINNQCSSLYCFGCMICDMWYSRVSPHRVHSPFSESEKSENGNFNHPPSPRSQRILHSERQGSNDWFPKLIVEIKDVTNLRGLNIIEVKTSLENIQ